MNKKIPDAIWMQHGFDGEISLGSGATWCTHDINDSDVEYIRADLAGAAPDLLAALKDAEKYEWHEGSCSVFARLQEDCDCSVMDFVKLARAAIAKAEGETI